MFRVAVLCWGGVAAVMLLLALLGVPPLVQSVVAVALLAVVLVWIWERNPK